MTQPRPPTTYWEVEATLAAEAEELWALFCAERGASGSETLAEGGGAVTLRCFFPDADPGPGETLAAEFRAAFPALPGPRAVGVRARPVENWGEAWRKFFAPIPVGERLLVCPPWQVPGPAAAGGRIPLVIDPGQGFGTGGHPSTWLALALLEAVLAAAPPPPRLLDVGTGSGILAIAGRLLGVAAAVGLDVDGRVAGDVRRNAALNHLPAPPRLVVGGPGCLRGAFPLVLANITVPVLLEESRALAGLTAPAGWLILSGLLAGEREPVEAAFRAEGLEPKQEREREGWVGLTLRRPV